MIVSTKDYSSLVNASSTLASAKVAAENVKQAETLPQQIDLQKEQLALNKAQLTTNAIIGAVQVGAELVSSMANLSQTLKENKLKNDTAKFKPAVEEVIARGKADGSIKVNENGEADFSAVNGKIEKLKQMIINGQDVYDSNGNLVDLDNVEVTGSKHWSDKSMEKIVNPQLDAIYNDLRVSSYGELYNAKLAQLQTSAQQGVDDLLNSYASSPEVINKFVESNGSKDSIKGMGNDYIADLSDEFFHNKEQISTSFDNSLYEQLLTNSTTQLAEKVGYADAVKWVDGISNITPEVKHSLKNTASSVSKKAEAAATKVGSDAAALTAQSNGNYRECYKTVEETAQSLNWTPNQKLNAMNEVKSSQISFLQAQAAKELMTNPLPTSKQAQSIISKYRSGGVNSQMTENLSYAEIYSCFGSITAQAQKVDTAYSETSDKLLGTDKSSSIYSTIVNGFNNGTIAGYGLGDTYDTIVSSSFGYDDKNGDWLSLTSAQKEEWFSKNLTEEQLNLRTQSKMGLSMLLIDEKIPDSVKPQWENARSVIKALITDKNPDASFTWTEEETRDLLNPILEAVYSNGKLDSSTIDPLLDRAKTLATGKYLDKVEKSKSKETYIKGENGFDYLNKNMDELDALVKLPSDSSTSASVEFLTSKGDKLSASVGGAYSDIASTLNSNGNLNVNGREPMFVKNNGSLFPVFVSNDLEEGSKTKNKMYMVDTNNRSVYQVDYDESAYRNSNQIKINSTKLLFEGKNIEKYKPATPSTKETRPNEMVDKYKDFYENNKDKPKDTSTGFDVITNKYRDYYKK